MAPMLVGKLFYIDQSEYMGVWEGMQQSVFLPRCCMSEELLPAYARLIYTPYRQVGRCSKSSMRFVSLHDERCMCWKSVGAPLARSFSCGLSITRRDKRTRLHVQRRDGLCRAKAICAL